MPGGSLGTIYCRKLSHRIPSRTRRVQDLIRRVPEILSEEARDKGNRYLATNLRTGYSVLIWLCADDPTPQVAKSMMQ